jgi:hypothetical protein
MKNVCLRLSVADCGLHPLIHTLLKSNLAQHLVSVKGVLVQREGGFHRWQQGVDRGKVLFGAEKCGESCESGLLVLSDFISGFSLPKSGVSLSPHATQRIRTDRSKCRI